MENSGPSPSTLVNVVASSSISRLKMGLVSLPYLKFIL